MSIDPKSTIADNTVVVFNGSKSSDADTIYASLYPWTNNAKGARISEWQTPYAGRTRWTLVYNAHLPAGRYQLEALAGKGTALSRLATIQFDVYATGEVSMACQVEVGPPNNITEVARTYKIRESNNLLYVNDSIMSNRLIGSAHTYNQPSCTTGCGFSRTRTLSHGDGTFDWYSLSGGGKPVASEMFRYHYRLVNGKRVALGYYHANAGPTGTWETWCGTFNDPNGRGY